MYKRQGYGLKEIQETIAKLDPLPGAKEFLDELRVQMCIRDRLCGQAAVEVSEKARGAYTQEQAQHLSLIHL